MSEILININQAQVVGSDALALQAEITIKGAASKDDALSILDRVMAMLAGGKRAFIRVRPEADTIRDFDMKTQDHRAYARLTFMDIAGEWEDSAYVFNHLPAIAGLKTKDAA